MLIQWLSPDFAACFASIDIFRRHAMLLAMPR